MRAMWCVVLTLAACAATKQGSATIGQPGGSVSAGDATLTVPAGAVTGNTSFTVTSSDGAPAPTNATVVGTAYVLGPEGAQFATPVVVKLGVDLAKLPSGKTINDVVIYTAPAGSTSYATLATTVADASHVQASTTHFSVFVPAVGMGCVVVCNSSEMADCSPSGCAAPTPTCSCTTQCNADGTPGSCAGGTGTTPMCTGNQYTFQCMGPTCVCQKDAAVTSTSFSCTGSNTPAELFAAYQGCGYPGSLQTIASGSDGGVPSGDGGAPMMGADGCSGGMPPCTPCTISCPSPMVAKCTPGGVMNGACVTQPTCSCQ